MNFFKWFMNFFKLLSRIEEETSSSINEPLNIDTTPIEEPIVKGKKYALIIGINKYMIPNADLNGCVNDAEDVYKELTQHYGYESDNVRMITDFRATKQNILERIEWLVSSLQSGDEGFLHFSGHGSQVRSRNDDTSELDDHMTEILCPTDLEWDDPLTDDIIADFFKRIPEGAFLTFICDSCHSGSISRGIGIQKMSNPHEWQPRFLAPPVDIMARSEGRNIEMRRMGRRVDNKVVDGNILEINQKHILLSGCKDNQTSADAFVGGKWGGALTQNFLKILSENRDKSWKEIHEMVVGDLKKQGYSQIPQLTGPKTIIAKAPLS